MLKVFHRAGCTKRSRSIRRMLTSGFVVAILAVPFISSADPKHEGFEDARHEGPGQGVGHNPGPLDTSKLPEQAKAKGVRFKNGTVNRKGLGHAPELDPSTGGSAAVLLLGGMLVTLGYRQRRKHS